MFTGATHRNSQTSMFCLQKLTSKNKEQIKALAIHPGQVKSIKNCNLALKMGKRRVKTYKREDIISRVSSTIEQSKHNLAKSKSTVTSNSGGETEQLQCSQQVSDKMGLVRLHKPWLKSQLSSHTSRHLPK